MLVRVANLGEVNHRLGRNLTDDLIQRFGKVMKQSTDSIPDALVARLNGADFALLLPTQNNGRDIATHLLLRLVEECTPFTGNSPAAYIGLGGFHRGQDITGLLANVDAALAGAEMAGINAIREAGTTDDSHAPKNAEAWASMIALALDNHRVRLASFPLVDFSGRLLHRECPLRLQFEEQGEWLPAGRFLPVAERLRLTPKIDLMAVQLGLAELDKQPGIPGLAINLSAASVHDGAFRDQLLDLLTKHPGSAKRLWLEIPESGALRHLDAFRMLCKKLATAGCRLGLEHFGRQFSQIGLLHDFDLNYLKVDSSFIRDLDSNPGNQAFLKGLSAIAHNIGLQVYAEGVITTAELNALQTAGFDGATGPGIKDPA